MNFFLVIGLLGVFTSATAQQAKWCVVFPNGQVSGCQNSQYNCDVGNSNKHMGATCRPMPSEVKQVNWCVVFPNGQVSGCQDSQHNCNVGNSNKHMGATCQPLPK